MRTTSIAQQLEFDGLRIDLNQHRRSTDFGSNTVNGGLVSPDTPSSVTPKTTVARPDFGTRGELYAVTSRLAGRVNAANISKAEHDELLRERQKLLDKQLDSTISRREANRLEYVRWSLDRIEDARHGAALDRLDEAVRMHEAFVADIGRLADQLKPHFGKRQ